MIVLDAKTSSLRVKNNYVTTVVVSKAGVKNKAVVEEADVSTKTVVSPFVTGPVLTDANAPQRPIVIEADVPVKTVSNVSVSEPIVTSIDASQALLEIEADDKSVKVPVVELYGPVDDDQLSLLPASQFFALEHGVDPFEVKPVRNATEVEAITNDLEASSVAKMVEDYDEAVVVLMLSQLIRAKTETNVELKVIPGIESKLMAAMWEKIRGSPPDPDWTPDLSGFYAEYSTEEDAIGPKAGLKYPTKFSEFPIKVNEKVAKNIIKQTFANRYSVYKQTLYSMNGLLGQILSTLGMSSGSFSLSEFLSSGAPFVDYSPTSHPSYFVPPKVTSLVVSSNENGAGNPYDTTPLPKPSIKPFETHEKEPIGEPVHEDAPLKKLTAASWKEPVEQAIDPPEEREKGTENDVPEFVYSSKSKAASLFTTDAILTYDRASDSFSGSDVTLPVAPAGALTFYDAPIVIGNVTVGFDPLSWTVNDDSSYQNVSANGLMLGSKTPWSRKEPPRGVAKYRSKAVQSILERGLDFMPNKFDVLFFVTYGGVTSQVHYLEPDDPYNMTTKAIGVRTASIEVPLPKTTTYETSFLGRKITHAASKVERSNKSSLVVDLDEAAYVVDLGASVAGLGYSRTGLGTVMNELVSSTWRSSTYGLGNKKVDVLVNHVSLMRDYGARVVEEFQTYAYNLEWNTKPDEMPFWVFEDVTFLGVEGELKFERESANQAQVGLPFVFRRVYLVDMTGEDTATGNTYGHGPGTRESLDAPLKSN